jgi:hypothetical protein
MKRGLMVWAVVTCMWAGVAGASVHEGEIDASLSGSWFNEHAGSGGTSFDGLFLSGGAGYFLTNALEIEAAALGIWTKGNPTVFAGEQKDTFYAFGGKAKYHFIPNSWWVPYLGGQFLWGHYDRDTTATQFDTEYDGFVWGPLAGVRFELNPHIDLFVEYQYQFWGGQVTHDHFDADGRQLSPKWDTGQLIALGFIVRFR